MNKAILVLAMLLYAIGVHAASVTINYLPAESTTATVNFDRYDQNNSSSPTAYFDAQSNSLFGTSYEFTISNDVVSDQGTWAKVSWIFNQNHLSQIQPTTIDTGKRTTSGDKITENIMTDYSYTLYMLGGHHYSFSILDGFGDDAMGVSLNVKTLSAVPLPPALWLLLPALVGLLGLRRKQFVHAPVRI